MIRYIFLFLFVFTFNIFAKTDKKLDSTFINCLSKNDISSCKEIMKEIYFKKHKIFRGIPTIDTILEKPEYGDFYLSYYDEYISGCTNNNSLNKYHKNWGITCDPQKVIDIYASLPDILVMYGYGDLKVRSKECMGPTILNRGNNEFVDYGPDTAPNLISQNAFGAFPGQKLYFGTTVVWDNYSYIVQSPFDLSYITCKINIEFKRKDKNVNRFKSKYPSLYKLFFLSTEIMQSAVNKAKEFPVKNANEKLMEEVYRNTGSIDSRLGKIISKPWELCYAKFYPENSICVVEDFIAEHHMRNIKKKEDVIPMECRIYVKNPSLKFDAPPKCKEYIENTEKAIEENYPGAIGRFACIRYTYIGEPYLITTVRKIGIKVEASLTNQYLDFVNNLFLNCVPYEGVPYIAQNTNTIGRDLYTLYRQYFIPLFIENLKQGK